VYFLCGELYLSKIADYVFEWELTIPEDSHLHTRRCENRNSHFLQDTSESRGRVITTEPLGSDLGNV
jgi:hypothetical protein